MIRELEHLTQQVSERIWSEFGIRLQTSSPMRIDLRSIQPTTKNYSSFFLVLLKSTVIKSGTRLQISSPTTINSASNITYQDCIEEHFNEVRDRAANLIGIDDWLSREDNKSTIYAKDERSQSPDADPAMGMAKDKKEIVIAVMGVTGAGKSSFIKGITSQDVFVGHGLNSGL